MELILSYIVIANADDFIHENEVKTIAVPVSTYVREGIEIFLEAQDDVLEEKRRSKRGKGRKKKKKKKKKKKGKKDAS